MKDWKRELEDLMNYVDPHGDAMAFWEAIGDYGEWNTPKVIEVIYPILGGMFQAQEEEHKKQMRKAIKDTKTTLVENFDQFEQDLGWTDELEAALFKKYNCEK